MLSSIAAALIAIRYYNTASRSARSPLSWAISGAMVYFLAALLWSLAITPAVKDMAVHTQSGLLIVIVKYAYIVFGLLCASAVNAWLNKADH